jgi:two-component system cell cycle response regulator
MLNPALDSVISNPALPSLPMVAMEVLELTARHDVDLREIERAIERDQAMSARVLRTVNSSYYGLTRRCGNIRQAVAFLGLETVKSLVLGFSLVKISDGCHKDEICFDFKQYWRRSFFCASVARTLCEMIQSKSQVDADEAFISALIQDVGMVALWRVHGDRYLQVVDMAGSDHNSITSMERRVFEVDHSQVGAEMTRRWSFPDSIVTAIEDHHRAISSMPEASDLSRVVRLAVSAVDLIDPCIDSPIKTHMRFERQVTSWFRLKPDQINEILERSLARAQELAATLDMNDCDIPTIDEILARADDARSRFPEAVAPEDIDGSSDLDETTGLPNRSHLLSDLESAFAGSGGEETVGLFLLGIDEVRALNERLGDRGGDDALAHVGQCVREFSQSRSCEARAYRFVGAEIAVILRNTDAGTALGLAEDLRAEIACRPARVVGRDGDSEFCSVHVTIGVGMHEMGTGLPLSPDGLLRAAMCAVTVGRRHGGDRVEFQIDDSTQVESGTKAA